MVDRLRLGYVLDFVDVRHRRPALLHLQRGRRRRSAARSCCCCSTRLPGRRLDDGAGPRASPGRPMPDAPIAAGVRTVRRAGRALGRIDRYVADVTGLSRSHVQKLISDGRLTADGVPLRANMVVRGRHGGPARRAGADRAGPRSRARHPLRHRVRGRRPADRRQAGGHRRPPVAGHHDGDTLVNALLARAGGSSTAGSPGSRARGSSIGSTVTRAACSWSPSTTAPRPR